MTDVNYSIRIDKELRDAAFSVLENYGLSPSQAFRLFLKQVAGTGTVPLTFDYAKSSIAYEKNPVTMQAIADAKAGIMTHFDSPEALLIAVKEDMDSEVL